MWRWQPRNSPSRRWRNSMAKNSKVARFALMRRANANLVVLAVLLAVAAMAVLAQAATLAAAAAVTLAAAVAVTLVAVALQAVAATAAAAVPPVAAVVMLVAAVRLVARLVQPSAHHAAQAAALALANLIQNAAPVAKIEISHVVSLVIRPTVVVVSDAKSTTMAIISRAHRLAL